VFDGHGKFGHDCSNYVHTFLPTAVVSSPEFDTAPEATCMKAFKMAHASLVMECDKTSATYDCILSGTTATVVVIR
jgi:serine/threonine protein phosphatase PrpC